VKQWRCLAILAFAAIVGPAALRPAAQAVPSVHITSPLGRTGMPGSVRIVAKVTPAPGTTIRVVHFLIDGEPFKDDSDPPYAVEWVDENPFERRELSAKVEDSLGRMSIDTVVLEPFEVTEKSEVFGAVFEAAVRDRRGRFVTGLGPSSFSIEEDGVPQTPDLVSPQAVPATFALLIDSSNSMSQRYDVVRQAADRLIGYLRPIDRVIVAPFTNEIGPLTGPTQDRDTAIEAIGSYRAGGGTAIADALKSMAERIAPMEGRHIIILITDGYDEHSQATFADATEALKKAQVTVYVVGMGGVAGVSLVGEKQVRQVAIESGGRAFFPTRDRELVSVYDQLALDAQNRYLVSYTPSNQRQDGSWRSVTVGAGSPDYIVASREGYFAPQAPPIRPMIEFIATDADERYADVTRDDLVVVEDGVPQQVEVFQEAVDPVQIVMALDESGSMVKAANAVKAAARDFVMALEPDDPLALITFADHALFAHDISKNRTWTLEAIDQYQALGGTALYDALYNSLTRLKFVQGRRAVVVLTDGRDENNPGTAPGSVHTLDEVIARAKEVEAAIFGIGLGTKVDRSVLERLADISAGRAYFPEDVGELAEKYRGIVENLRRRYIVGYTSTNLLRDGKWRKVDISVRGANMTVRSRGGYLAPEK
jgi:VWFA-related protein